MTQENIIEAAILTLISGIDNNPLSKRELYALEILLLNNLIQLPGSVYRGVELCGNTEQELEIT